MSEQSLPDETTWGAFLTRLQGYVGQRVDPAQRDDVVGDILLRLVQNQAQLAAAERPLAWIYRVAGNAVTDHYRRRAVERRALGAVGREAEIDASAEPDNEAGDLLAQCLTPMIRQLPDKYAEALMLTEIEGLTQAAAAERLGLSLSGLKSRVQRGRRLLRQDVLRCCAVELDRRGGVLAVEPRRQNDREGGCGCNDGGGTAAP